MKNDFVVQPGFVTPGEDVMALVRDVSATINDIIRNESGKPLAKSEEKSSPGSGGGMLPVKKGEGSESSSSSSSSELAKASPPVEESSSSSSSLSEGTPADAPPADAPPADEGAAPGPSYQDLVQMYTEVGKSNPQDLQAHAAAIQEALQSLQAPPAPSAPPVNSAPPSAGPAVAPMGKSEQFMLDELKKTQDQMGAIAETLRVIVSRPQRKAVNGISFIPYQKNEEPAVAKLAFSELKKNAVAMHEELKRLTMPDSPLSKKERDLVNDFYCRRISVDALAPIFAEPKK
jgi:hypothetical protein